MYRSQRCRGISIIIDINILEQNVGDIEFLRYFDGEGRGRSRLEATVCRTQQQYAVDLWVNTRFNYKRRLIIVDTGDFYIYYSAETIKILEERKSTR